MRYVNDNLLNSFLDAHLKKEGSAPTGGFSFPTQCPILTSKPPLVSGRSWDGMRAGILRLKGNGSRTTVSSPPNAAEEGPAKSGRCITQSPGSYDDQADWTWSVPDNGFTLLGLPTVKVKYQLAGEDAIVVAKLWDVGPDGTRTLVTRGVYRLSVVGGDQRSGKISFQLFGNHWKFERGHSMTLELSQTDAPFLRSDDLPSSITFTEPQVDLPKGRSPSA